MKQPFEGLFGDTCETRLLQFLLPMYGIEFDMAELTREIGLTRQSIAKAMKKFSDHGMVKIRRDGRTWLYAINEESPLVKRLEDFDNSLIESMVGEEKFRKMEAAHEKQIHASSRTASKRGSKKALIRYDTSRQMAPGVASKSGTYLKGKRPERPLKIIVEKHADGYVAYPVGMKGIVVGEGDTYEEAVDDVTSAIRFHIETFGKDAFEDEEVIDTKIAEVIV